MFYNARNYKLVVIYLGVLLVSINIRVQDVRDVQPLIPTDITTYAFISLWQIPPATGV